MKELPEEDRVWVSLSLSNALVDAETAGKIVQLLNNARGVQWLYVDSRVKYFIGGKYSIHLGILSPAEFAEGLINGPEKEDT